MFLMTFRTWVGLSEYEESQNQIHELNPSLSLFIIIAKLIIVILFNSKSKVN